MTQVAGPLLCLAIGCAAGDARAAEPPEYAVEDALVRKETDQEIRYSIDVRVIKYFIDRIARYASAYPPRFEDADEREQIEGELRNLITILDMLREGNPSSAGLLLDAGFAYAMGHNLDLPGSSQKAIDTFEALLREYPDHPMGNYRYGAFLASTARLQQQSVAYLERSAALGVERALFTLGVVHVSQHRPERGLEYLERYLALHPDSEQTHRMIQAIRAGRIEHRLAPSRGDTAPWAISR